MLQGHDTVAKRIPGLLSGPGRFPRHRCIRRTDSGGRTRYILLFHEWSHLCISRLVAHTSPADAAHFGTSISTYGTRLLFFLADNTGCFFDFSGIHYRRRRFGGLCGGLYTRTDGDTFRFRRAHRSRHPQFQTGVDFPWKRK